MTPINLKIDNNRKGGGAESFIVGNLLAVQWTTLCYCFTVFVGVRLMSDGKVGSFPLMKW